MHDKPAPPDPESMPNRDLQVSEEILNEYPQLFSFLGRSLADAAVSIPGAVDRDVQEAIEALIRTYRTLQSGVYYESLPSNLVAAEIYRMVQQRVDEFRHEESRRGGVSRTRDALVLGYLAVFQRMAIAHDNHRPRGRAFVSALVEIYGVSPPAGPRRTSSLILP
jgi:hypothetical protein